MKPSATPPHPERRRICGYYIHPAAEVKPAFDLFFEAAAKVYTDLADAVEKLAP